MALQRLYEAAEKAKIELSTAQETQINLPFITADADRPEAPRHAPDPLEAHRAHRQPARPRGRPGAPGAGRREGEGRGGDRRHRPRRRHDAHARRAGEGQGAHGQGAAPRRQPGRGRGRRRRHPGGRARRRRQGRPAARRDPADAGHRDQGRRDDQAHRAQHHDPDAQDRDLHHGGGQPAVAWRSTSCRASARWRRYNKSLGKFQLTGIPPAPRGIPQIEVTFDIDANGILSVSAKDLGTGKEQKIEIKAGGGLSRRRDQEDGLRRRGARRRGPQAPRELAEARNTAENAAYQAEKQLTDLGDAVDADSKTEIEGLIKEVRESVASDDAAAITREDRGAADGVPQGLRAHVRAGAGQRRRPRTARASRARTAPTQRATRPRTSSTPRSWTRAGSHVLVGRDRAGRGGRRRGDGGSRAPSPTRTWSRRPSTRRPRPSPAISPSSRRRPPSATSTSRSRSAPRRTSRTTASG